MRLPSPCSQHNSELPPQRGVTSLLARPRPHASDCSEPSWPSAAASSDAKGSARPTRVAGRRGRPPGACFRRLCRTRHAAALGRASPGLSCLARNTATRPAAFALCGTRQTWPRPPSPRPDTATRSAALSPLVAHAQTPPRGLWLSPAFGQPAELAPASLAQHTPLSIATRCCTRQSWPRPLSPLVALAQTPPHDLRRRLTMTQLHTVRRRVSTGTASTFRHHRYARWRSACSSSGTSASSLRPLALGLMFACHGS